MATWQIQDGKNKLSEMIDRAISEGPQVITRRGVEIAVVLPIALYRKLTAPKRPLGDFLMASPLRGSKLVVERDPSRQLRAIDL